MRGSVGKMKNYVFMCYTARRYIGRGEAKLSNIAISILDSATWAGKRNYPRSQSQSLIFDLDARSTIGERRAKERDLDFLEKLPKCRDSYSPQLDLAFQQKLKYTPSPLIHTDS